MRNKSPKKIAFPPIRFPSIIIQINKKLPTLFPDQQEYREPKSRDAK